MHAHAHPHDHQGHGHGHGHGHGPHHHHHAPADFGRAFAVGIALNTAFVLLEAGAGLAYGSMALIADAGHNLSDVLALALAWGASIAARRPASGRFTYGYKSSTILAALANALLLAAAIGAIGFETLHRMMNPVNPEGYAMMAVAGIGIVINALTAMLFVRGQDDLNIRGAYLHMAADAAVSLGVVVAGLAIVLTGMAWIDGGKPRHSRGDRLGHLGPGARQLCDGAAGRAGADRSFRCKTASCFFRRGGCGA